MSATPHSLKARHVYVGKKKLKLVTDSRFVVKHNCEIFCSSNKLINVRLSLLADDLKTCRPAEQNSVLRASLTEWEERKSAGLHQWSVLL